MALPKAVFWDWDGTLVDSYSFLNDAHNHTLEKLGLPQFKDGDYKQYFGIPRDIIYPAIYKEKADDALVVFQEYVTQNSEKIQTLSGAGDCLKFLHENNVTMGIVSNKKKEFIQAEVGHRQWEKYFSIIVGSGDAHQDKPSSAPLLLALVKANVTCNMDDVWYVGDTENDLACADEAGCRSLFLKGDEQSTDLIQKYSPHFSFDNHTQLQEFLVAI